MVLKYSTRRFNDIQLFVYLTGLHTRTSLGILGSQSIFTREIPGSNFVVPFVHSWIHSQAICQVRTRVLVLTSLLSPLIAQVHGPGFVEYRAGAHRGAMLPIILSSPHAGSIDPGYKVITYRQHGCYDSSAAFPLREGGTTKCDYRQGCGTTSSSKVRVSVCECACVSVLLM